MGNQDASGVEILAWPARRNEKHNTYTKRLYDELQKNRFIVTEFTPKRSLLSRYDVLHIHWPDGVLKTRSLIRAVWMTFMMICVLGYVAYIRRKPIVWTVHNIRPHASRHLVLWRVICWTLTRTVTYLIHLSSAASEEMTRELPATKRIPRTIIHHGRYEGEYLSNNTRHDTRRSLKISGSSYVFAFLGAVNEYKGALELATVFSDLACDEDISLVIAGSCEQPDYKCKIESLALEDPRIRFIPEYLASDRLADLAEASDMTVFPYRSILNSGSIFVPLELGKPVLAPAIGSIPEMQRLVGDDWVRTYEGSLSTPELLKHVGFVPSGAPNLSEFAWPQIAFQTGELYCGILGRGLDGRDKASGRKSKYARKTY